MRRSGSGSGSGGGSGERDARNGAVRNESGERGVGRAEWEVGVTSSFLSLSFSFSASFAFRSWVHHDEAGVGGRSARSTIFRNPAYLLNDLTHTSLPPYPHQSASSHLHSTRARIPPPLHSPPPSLTCPPPSPPPSAPSPPLSPPPSAAAPPPSSPFPSPSRSPAPPRAPVARPAG